MKTRSYKPPLNAVYNTGKRKERCTKAINLVNLLLSDSPDNEDLSIALSLLKRYRENFNEL